MMKVLVVLQSNYRKFVVHFGDAKSILSAVVKLAKLILVFHATNVSSEQSFSALRRAKTYKVL